MLRSLEADRLGKKLTIIVYAIGFVFIVAMMTFLSIGMIPASSAFTWNVWTAIAIVVLIGPGVTLTLLINAIYRFRKAKQKLSYCRLVADGRFGSEKRRAYEELSRLKNERVGLISQYQKERVGIDREIIRLKKALALIK